MHASIQPSAVELRITLSIISALATTASNSVQHRKLEVIILSRIVAARSADRYWLAEMKQRASALISGSSRASQGSSAHFLCVTVSIWVMTAGEGYRYLLNSVVLGECDAASALIRYYVESGTPPGTWIGSGTAELPGDVAARAR